MLILNSEDASARQIPLRKGGFSIILALLGLVFVVAAVAYVYGFRHHTSTPRPAPETLPAEKGTRIVCPSCNGEGRLLLTNSVSCRSTSCSASPTPARSTLRGCQICGGIGYRDLKMPADARLCPDCHGMGRLFMNEAGMGRTMACPRCSSRGYTTTP